MARDYAALARYVAARTAMPFVWGSNANDCVSYAAGAVKAQTGRNLLRGVRWTTARGAARVLRRFGGLEEAVSSRLNDVPPALAHRGDVALVEDLHSGPALMIVEGATLVGPGNRRAPRSAMVRAWSADV